MKRYNGYTAEVPILESSFHGWRLWNSGINFCQFSWTLRSNLVLQLVQKTHGMCWQLYYNVKSMKKIPNFIILWVFSLIEYAEIEFFKETPVSKILILNKKLQLNFFVFFLRVFLYHVSSQMLIIYSLVVSNLKVNMFLTIQQKELKKTKTSEITNICCNKISG